MDGEEINDSPIVNESDDASFKDDGEIEVAFEGEESPEQHEEHREEEVEDEPKPKKIKNVQTRINQLQRDKYRAINQAQEAAKQAEYLLQENQRLQSLSETNNQAAMIHYDQSVRLQETQAKDMLTRAIETGDVALQIEATELLTSAKSEMKNLEAWRVQEKMRNEPQRYQEPQRQQYQQHQYEQEQPLQLNEETTDWLESNPWMSPDSDEFDPDLADEVIQYATALDKRLMRTGQQDKIMSREYYDNINRYINGDEKPPSRTLTMKQSNIPVSGVGKNAVQGRTESKTRVVLSPQEKEMANLLKLPFDVYAKHVLQDRQLQAQRGR